MVQPLIAMALLATGFFLFLIPGPGLPLVVVGAALLAERSLPLARALDWLEVKLRNIVGRAVSLWRRASVAAKNALILGALLAVAGAGYCAYCVVFGQ